MDYYGVCGFDESGFDTLQQQHQQQQQIQQHFSPSINIGNVGNEKNGMFALEDSAEKQRQEFDGFINLQSEGLKFVIQKQRNEDITRLVESIEAESMNLLRQKDEAIAKATNKTIELQNIITKLQLENQAWQKLAYENETMVTYLNNSIQQLKQRHSVQDSESCCNLRPNF